MTRCFGLISKPKKLTKMKSYLPVLILIFGLFSLHLSSQEIDCFVLKTPEKEFYDIQKIGVLEFKCTNNQRLNNKMSDLIVADLLDQYRGIVIGKSKSLAAKQGKEGQTFVRGVKTDFYQVIERDQLQRVLKEQRLSLSGALDEGSAAEVGKVLGLDAILMGNVSYTSTDKKGSSLLGLTTTSNSYCLKRTVTVRGTMKIVSVETAQIVGTKNASFTMSENKCDNQISSLKKPEEYAEILFKSMARSFTDYFAPGYQFVEYEMEKVKLKEFKSQANEALDFIENGDLDRAFPIVYAMFEADSYNPKAAYNLGVLYEMVGAYEDANEYYGIAYELDYSNDKYRDATERASSGLLLTEYLEEIGRPVQPYSFTGGGNALAERVKVKGSSADRIEVYSLPDQSSEIAAKVPGGLEFKVIGQNGKFIEIQLRGTKTGFINKSDVK
jgi:hypothetical protein